MWTQQIPFYYYFRYFKWLEVYSCLHACFCSTCIHVRRWRSHDLCQQINGKEAYFAVQIRVKDIVFKTPEAADMCMHAHPHLILAQFKACKCVHIFKYHVYANTAQYTWRSTLSLWPMTMHVCSRQMLQRKPPTAADNCCLSHICAGLMPHV